MYAPVCTRFITYDVALGSDDGAILPNHHGDAADAGMDRRCQGRARRLGELDVEF
jgi:hypothetical protein